MMASIATATSKGQVTLPCGGRSRSKPATRLLADAEAAVLTDVIVAEAVCVLSSVYGVGRPDLARALRSLLAMSSVLAEHDQIVRRSLHLCEAKRMDVADASSRLRHRCSATTYWMVAKRSVWRPACQRRSR